MTLLRHLVAADLRRFGWLIAAWVTLVAAGVVVYAWLPLVAGSQRTSEALRMTSGVLWLAEQVYRLVIIALIVHAHPAVGSTAFWMTRPIPPRLLLASKALLIGAVTVGAPVVADLALALKYSVPAADMLMSALQTALVNGLWVAVCFTIAVVTRSFAQFTLVCGVAASTLVLAPVAVELAVSSRRAAASARHDVPFSPAILVTAAVVFIAVLVVAWIVQYTRRRRPETIALSASGACLALLVGTVTPPSFMMAQDRSPDWARGATLQISSDSPTPYLASETAAGSDSSAIVKAIVTMPSLPQGWAAQALLEDATVQADGVSLDSQGSASTNGVALSRSGNDDEHPMRIALAQALAVERVPGAFYGLEPTTVFVRPGAEAERLGNLRGRYHGRFRVALTHVEAVGVLPLTRHAVFQEGAYRLTIRDVRFDDALTVRVQLSDVTAPAVRGGQRSYEFYLRNRAHREALAGTRRPARDFSVIPGATTLADFAMVAPGCLDVGGVPDLPRKSEPVDPEVGANARLAERGRACRRAAHQ